MEIQRAEELIVQTGSTIKDKDAGFIDPKTGITRTIPLEIFYKNDKEPVYGITSDDDSRATETKALPFQAYGALGMARGNDDPDSASSQFFFLKWLQALVAPGRNTLDGYYSCFGYVIKNEDAIKELHVGDTIVYAKVIEGAENLFANEKGS
jgi:peptidylprolyl isomerase